GLRRHPHRADLSGAVLRDNRLPHDIRAVRRLRSAPCRHGAVIIDIIGPWASRPRSGQSERSMETRAAVAHKAGQPLSIETVRLEGPQAGEVLVEVKGSGICHTDASTLPGPDRDGLFP